MSIQGSALQVITTSARRGAEVFAVDLERALCARGRDARTVALVPGHDARARLEVPVLGDRRLALSTLRHLRTRIRDSEVVVGHGSSTLPACAIAGLATGVPFVYRNVGDPAFWGTTRARRARVGLFLRRANVVVALTARTADALAQRYGVPRPKIRVIPKGVPADRFPLVDATGRAAARRALGIGDGASVVAYVGALSPEKDPEGAIRAVALLGDAQLVMAGEGPEREHLERLAAEVSPGRVSFLGPVDDPGVVYAAADTLVVSSRTEGLPGVLMEAGLSGLPAVTTDVGFVRDIVRDGETGFVVAPGDPTALAAGIRAALAASPTVGPAARAHCLARFDLAWIAQQWDALLTEVVAGRTR